MADEHNNTAASDNVRLKLEERCRRTRNVCIVAHVDHGKTTLSDSLVAYNGHIHPRLAGKLRFLDSREDEQKRGITMKASSIALLFKKEQKTEMNVDQDTNDDKYIHTQTPFIINLIDSPGHVDFCSEVSTSVRLSDGALVVVDACEGVCIQTYAVLRQVWQEQLQPVLIVNKLDRLMTELALSPTECYGRLERIVRDVNSIISMFQSERFLNQADAFMAHMAASEQRHGTDSEVESAFVPDCEDEEDTFNVIKGNVVFASAIDGWGFRTSQFASLYAERLGCSENALSKAFWGDFFYNKKTKKLFKSRSKNGMKPLFVQMILDPIYKAYALADLSDRVSAEMENMASKLKIDISKRELSNSKGKVAVQTFMRAWLPLSECLMNTIVDVLPNPIDAAGYRMSHLMPKIQQEKRKSVISENASLVDSACKSCDVSFDAPVVAFVSKIIPVSATDLEAARRNKMEDSSLLSETNIKFLGFCRVFSGVIKVGHTLYVLFPNYEPPESDENLSCSRQMEKIHNPPTSVQVSGIYIMMGTGLQSLDFAAAGSIVALEGVSEAISKSATLSSSLHCRPIATMMFQSAPIVRVAIEPKDPTKLSDLANGLKLLNQADPFVEISFQDTGEHVLGAAGEVHLETCLKDLQERFAKIDLEISPPLVSFRESISAVNDQGEESLDNFEGPFDWGDVADFTIPSGLVTIHVRVSPMNAALARAVEEMHDILEPLLGGEIIKNSFEEKSAGEILVEKVMSIVENGDSRRDLSSDDTIDVVRSSSKRLHTILSSACSFGPKNCGPNILIANATQKSKSSILDDADLILAAKPSAAIALGFVEDISAPTSISNLSNDSDDNFTHANSLISTIDSSIISGFQLATSAGPLCEEPMWGINFSIEISLHGSHEDIRESESQFGPLSGQLIPAIRDTCRAAVKVSCPRLVEALFLCEATTTAETLGNTYAVLGRRRSKVLREEMQEGSGLFCIHAYLPVASSFKFVDELRRSTSGAASAQLILSHWERLNIDPFFVPKTFEEREEHGETVDNAPNIARNLIDSVRRRKGLYVQEKLVERATKQRTLARKT